MKKNTRILLIALLAIVISSCGVVIEEKLLWCDATGSNKTYRDVGCQRQCKAAYRNCTNGKIADPEKDCECSKDVGGIYIPNNGNQLTVPTTIASSCACYNSGTRFVNLHLAGTCPLWLPKIGAEVLTTGIGRPINSGDDPTCTNICESSSSRELRGVFKFHTTGPGACIPQATMFPGTIAGKYFSGGELAQAIEDAPPQFIARARLRMQKLNYRLAGLQPETTMIINEGATRRAVFNMVKLDVDCMKECIDSGENCTEFKISDENKASIMSILAKLPADGVANSIDISKLRYQSFNSPTSCQHATVEFGRDGSVKSAGARCEQQLYLQYPGIENFDASVTIPSLIDAHASTTPSYRTMVFSDENSMISLKLSPNQLHQLYGGKIRAIWASSDRVTLETQNSCIAIALKQ